MVRREVVRGLLASGAALGVSACGGGSGSSSQALAGGTGAAPAPAPAPTPTPTPTPPPVPTLRGITIEQAQADIAQPIASGTQWLDTPRTVQTEVVVTSADEFQSAVNQLFDTQANPQALALNQRIVCAWNGPSMLAAGLAARVTVGAKLLATGHMDAGGSLVIAAAPGHAPDFANTVYVSGRGIKFQGIGFTRKALAGENADAINSVTLLRTATYPVTSFVAFDACHFGSRSYVAQSQDASWVNGLGGSGQVADFVSFRNCNFIGLQNAAKIVTKALRVDGCDFQAVLQDCIALYGHTFETGYYAHAWISRSTFRNSPDEWAARSAHSDTIQTGTSADRHLGYRLLVTDVLSHLGRSYSGESGLGGGSQGIYNDDHLTADNQFVVRRSVFLVTAPHGFCYYSPRASRPSFVDQSVFTRAGRTPSAFAPDTRSSDMAVGITGAEPPGGPWLLVTDTIAKRILSLETNTLVSVDPRMHSSIAVTERPESIFVGRDFSRGGAASNFIADKFAYTLPNERGTRSGFIEDVWANFQAKAGATGRGIPSPLALNWHG
jgi:hypothetical protein